MKYIEELSAGDSFRTDNIFIITSDFKKNGDRRCVDLSSGSSRWIPSNTIVDVCPIYTLDTDNNITSIKPTKKDEQT